MAAHECNAAGGADVSQFAELLLDHRRGGYPRRKQGRDNQPAWHCTEAGDIIRVHVDEVKGGVICGKGDGIGLDDKDCRSHPDGRRIPTETRPHKNRGVGDRVLVH